MTPKPAPAHTKLAYIVSTYPAISHTFILREVRALRERGFDIVVASVNAADRPLDQLTLEERQEADQTYYIKRHGVVGALLGVVSALLRPHCLLRGVFATVRLAGWDLKAQLYGVFYLVEALMVARWMRRQGTDHLHAHFATPASTVGLIASKAFGTGLSMTVHGPDEFYDAPGYHLREKIEAARFIVCISRFARSQLMKLSEHRHWHKFDVVHLGVDPDLFHPRDRQRAGSPAEVLCVGRLVEAKGQHILIEAVAQLAERKLDLQLRLVGNGPDEESLRSLARELGVEQQVRFEGAVDQDRIRTFFGQADVFALASFAEGIPVVLMEAMAMEVPCVTTWITGHPELIRDGVDGILVPPSDVAQLADAVERLVNDPQLHRQLSRAGRERVRDVFNLPNNVELLGEVFGQRLRRGARFAQTSQPANGAVRSPS